MTYDTIILGSSFSGSLLGWILAARGMRVLVVDRGRHPRFAIGESSTPAADLILADLAARHRLPELAPLARWGSWQASYPQLGCGKKRGFSYFLHRPGEPFRDTPDHAASLLVAASATDAGSDTHWLRADVDAFLCERSARAGAIVREGCEVVAIERRERRWKVRFAAAVEDGLGPQEQASAPFLLDATGGGGASAAALGMKRLDDTLHTRCGAIFGHFTGVGSWDRLQEAAGNRSTTSPFQSDDAAQHHCLDDGWMWILRFRDDLASVGVVQPTGVCQGWAAGGTALESVWRRILALYPSLADLLAASRPVRPLGLIPRMSRLWSRASGEGFAMLPTTAGFVDPLHSTGIAHALSGVERLADLLLAESFDEVGWEAYGAAVIDEVAWIDQLVSACYAVLPDFDRFRLASTLFFLATVAAERGYGRGETTTSQGFLAARNTPLRSALAAARGELVAGGEATAERLRDRLAPFDPVGLLDPAARQRFAHTAVDK